MKISSKTVKALEDVLAYESGRQHRGRVTRVTVGDVNVKVIREELKLSQEAFAERFGFSLATLKNWEQGRREPEEAAKTLLRLIESQPKLVEKHVRRAHGDPNRLTKRPLWAKAYGRTWPIVFARTSPASQD